MTTDRCKRRSRSASIAVVRRDYMLSFLAEGVAVALALGSYRVAASQWDPEVFGEYALARKILSVVLVIALLGVDIAIVRYLAFEAGGDHRKIASYVSGALTVFTVTSITIAIALATFAGPLSTMLFGRRGHEDLVTALGILAFGGGLYGIAYGYLRGRLRLGRAGILLVISSGVVPLVAIVQGSSSVGFALVLIGIGWAAVAGLAIFFERRTAWGQPQVRPVLAYGAPRAVGQVIQMAFLAAPAVVAAHRFGIAEGGNVAFGLLVVGLVSTGLTPIGVVLMPRSADLLRGGADRLLEAHVVRLLALVTPAVVSFVLLVQLFADPLVAIFLGPGYAASTNALRGILWAAIPWMFFVALRGLIDAHDVRPLNARNLAIASTTYALLVLLAISIEGDAAAFYAAFDLAAIVLAGLTLVAARGVFARPPLPEPVVEDLLQP